MGNEWDKLGGVVSPESGGGFAKPGIGEREIPWPSFSATSKFGTSNPTCGECGGRLRGAKKCTCPKPHDHWKPIGKRRKLPQDTPNHITGGGMDSHLQAMQVWHLQWLEQAYRVLEPGGVIKAFSATRTYHRLAAAMEDAGFVDIHLEAWTYGSGFPKSKNIALFLDKRAKAIGNRGRAIPMASTHFPGEGKYSESGEKLTSNIVETYEPRTPEAEKWNGWGTAIKPAWEPVVVGVKP